MLFYNVLLKLAFEGFVQYTSISANGRNVDLHNLKWKSFLEKQNSFSKKMNTSNPQCVIQSMNRLTNYSTLPVKRIRTPPFFNFLLKFKQFMFLWITLNDTKVNSNLAKVKINNLKLKKKCGDWEMRFWDYIFTAFLQQWKQINNIISINNFLIPGKGLFLWNLHDFSVLCDLNLFFLT